MKHHANDRLTISRFRTASDTNALSEDDFIDFVFAKMMQEVIQRLEASIQNDRIFSRTKYDVMAIFHNHRTLIDHYFESLESSDKNANGSSRSSP